MNEERLEVVKNYLIWRFNRFNHPKYRKYCMEWIENIHINQINYFMLEMERLIQKGGVRAMMREKEIGRCLEILKELMERLSTTSAYPLLVELAYFLRREHEMVIDENLPQDLSKVSKEELVKDNVRLFHDNLTLLESNKQLHAIIDEIAPSIITKLQRLQNRIQTLSNDIKE